MSASIEEVINEVDNALCASCFDVLEHELNGLEPPSRPLMEMLSSRHVACPLFVTWMSMMPDGEEELRGCIGTLTPVPISKLGQYAFSSAFRDTRFDAIVAAELPHLVCGVSLLHTFEKASHRKDWEIGTHGIVVSFEQDGKSYSATFLPEVAEEHKMTKSTAVRRAIQKSGYRGQITDELLESVEVTRYQSKKLKMSYAQYKAL